MIIKLNTDKSLQITKISTIIQGEYYPDALTFYVPRVIENVDISQTGITAIITLPDQSVITHNLNSVLSEYSDYLKFTLFDDEHSELQKNLTAYSGVVNIRLEIKDNNNHLIKSELQSFYVEPVETEKHCCEHTSTFCKCNK